MSRGHALRSPWTKPFPGVPLPLPRVWGDVTRMRQLWDEAVDAPEFPAACILAVGTVALWLIPVLAL